MPRSGSGTYTLPVASYVSGTTIVSADMNTNLGDIASALTTSLATTGVSSMTGPIKAFDGSVGAPGYALASDPTTGFYRNAAGTFGYASSGVHIMNFSSAGIVIASGKSITDGNGLPVTGRLVGEIIDYGGATEPSGWIFLYGQAISRTTYSVLFGIFGTTFGSGDGLTTFNVPDARGRASFGKDNMGGSTAGRITVAGGNFDATVLGAVGGAQNHTMTTGELVTHSHGVTDAGHTHTEDAEGILQGAGGGATGPFQQAAQAGSTGSSTTGITINNAGSSTAFTVLPPAIIFNKMVYTGVH
jgi:microcystin-dependent protein